MVKLSNPPLPTDIENAIHYWLDLLAEGKYTEAFEYTVHDPYYAWTPILLEKVINGYGLPDENEDAHKYSVTKWNEAVTNGRARYKEVIFYDKHGGYKNGDFLTIGEARYDLPLDGEWSDLTAIFAIMQAKDFTTLELNDIHVL